MLRGLSSGLSIFPVFINVKIIRIVILVQAQTSKLNCCLVYGVISGHDDCLLLFQDSPLETSTTVSGSSGLESGSLVSSNARASNWRLSSGA